MGNMSEASKELFAILQAYSKKALNEWLQNYLFTWQWWLGVVISIVP